MLSLHSRRWAALAAAGATVAGGWAAFSAGTATAADSGATRSVTVLLDAPDPAGLARLSAQPITDRAQRLRQLAALVPSAAQRSSVTAALRSEGFTVAHQSTWSVTATAPASVVTENFGVRPALASNPTAAQWRAATGPLPEVPAALSGLVSVAYPTTGGPAPFQHEATSTLAGPDFRKADTPAHTTPSSGVHNSGLTVATLQLSTFNSSDLSHYATEHKIHDPVANHYFAEEQVDGGSTDSDGDIEVDLDQQSILSTARNAHQLAYFAPNTDAGFSDVFANLYDDVTGARGAQHPDPHLVAISVSWGQCEAGWGASGVNALEPVMESVVAAGVNIFASSGDDGIYDCRSTSGTGADNTQDDVDFPASSPVVVGVGGTNLSAPKSTANTGTNWVEKSWSCTSAASCEGTAGTGGTGGGVSGAAYGSGLNQGDFKGFAKPAYQRTYVTSAPFAATTTRMVPDIAADGDPETGFELYTSDTQYVAECGGNNCQVGGTSLAAPISAAQFANLLGDSGQTTGVGDIHAALYKAEYQNRNRPATSSLQPFRDVTVGSNGAAANAGKDPSVNAATGYDTNTGLGGVLWPGLKSYLVP